MNITTDTHRDGQGHWVFTARADDGSSYVLVHPDKFTPFTEEQKEAMKRDALCKFRGMP